MDLKPLAPGVLRAVSYSLFENESHVDWANDESELHQLDREVVLEFEGGRRVFVSWAGNTDASYSGHDDYFVLSIAAESQWTDPPFLSVDMTESPMWRELTGKVVAAEQLESEYYLVCVTSDDAKIFLSSLNDDIIAISKNDPRFLG